MADKTKIDGSVEVVNNSRERVAFEIARYLNGYEESFQDKFLELYSRCLLTGDYPSTSVEQIKRKVKDE